LNIIYKSSLFSIVLALSPQSLADNNYTLGLGVGTMYGGLGMNAGVQSDVDIKYVSAGILQLSGNSTTYGLGLGWITTDLFDFQSKKHGINIYVGAVGTENSFDGYDPVYGGGLGYSYFFSGIDQSGLNIGFTLLGGKGSKESETGAFIQAGYQF
jgi:hypothetical protein